MVSLFVVGRANIPQPVIVYVSGLVEGWRCYYFLRGDSSELGFSSSGDGM